MPNRDCRRDIETLLAVIIELGKVAADLPPGDNVHKIQVLAFAAADLAEEIRPRAASLLIND